MEEEKITNKVLLSLGSNLGDRIQNINAAIQSIGDLIGLVSEKSNFHYTPPLDFDSDNEFVNCCIVLKTSKSCLEVLNCNQEIESKMGRVRSGSVYQDRIIDIDIIFFNDLIYNSDELIIPHPKYHLRDFVLLPMKELSTFIDPREKKNILVTDL